MESISDGALDTATATRISSLQSLVYGLLLKWSLWDRSCPIRQQTKDRLSEVGEQFVRIFFFFFSAPPDELKRN